MIEHKQTNKQSKKETNLFIPVLYLLRCKDNSLMFARKTKRFIFYAKRNISNEKFTEHAVTDILTHSVI